MQKSAPQLSSGASKLLVVPLGALAALVAGFLMLAVFLGVASPSCEEESLGALNSKVPQRLVPIYIAAAEEYKLGIRGPSILASINEIESAFGSNMGRSSAGAIGWMQFMPETWAGYGVDANGDGIRDPYDPEDAIFAAANYLHASGAPGNWSAAILAYNHADWYVEDVLAGAGRFAGNSSETSTVSESTACGATGPAGPKLEKIVAEADRLDALHLAYVAGGSHGASPTPPNGPFDCSSAVSHLLQVAGFGNPTMDTTALIAWGDPGRGSFLTIHIKPYGADAHTFIEFDPSVTPDDKRYWGTSRTNPNGGPGWIPKSAFSMTYLAGFQVRHPPGL
jgi:Transglycosylase SLT domain